MRLKRLVLHKIEVSLPSLGFSLLILGFVSTPGRVVSQWENVGTLLIILHILDALRPTDATSV